MPEGSARKIAIGVLAVLTIGLGAIAVILGINLASQEGPGESPITSSSSSTSSANTTSSVTSQTSSATSSSSSSDIPVAGVCCGGGSCDNGFNFGPDLNYTFGSCGDRLAAVEAEQRANCSGSDQISCPTEPPTPPPNPQGCTPSVSNNTVIGFAGCEYTDSFNGRRRMTGPGDECYVNQSNAQGGYSSGKKTGPVQWTADPGKCYCQQVDLEYGGRNYGTKASGGWDSSCSGGGSTTTTTSRQCGDSCNNNNQCPNNHVCSGGTCQLPFCVNNPGGCSADGCEVTSDISIVKTSELGSCSVDGAASINYRIVIDNLGGSAEVIDQVVDAFDTSINASQVSAVSNGGVVSGNTITWTGPFNVNSGASLQFTYTITLTGNQVTVFNSTGGVENVVTVTYGPDSRTFTLLTPLTCLPNTSLFDEPLGILVLGIMLILAGVVFNRLHVVNQLFFNFSQQLKRHDYEKAQSKISKTPRRQAKRSKYEQDIIDRFGN